MTSYYYTIRLRVLQFIGIVGVLYSCTVKTYVPTEKESSSFISQDKLGAVYQIGEMRIIKYSSSLDTVRTNSIFNSGSISSLDTRNPLQLMLFYKQQQEIILLDNTLSETNKISLSQFDWVDLACLSNRDNSFWLYSISNQELIKTDKNSKVVDRFKNISQLLRKEINPTQLIEYDNSVYLFDPNHGMFEFDLFGNYVKQIFLKEAESIKFSQKKVFFRSKNRIYSYNLLSFDKKLEYESSEEFDDFAINNSQIITVSQSKIKTKKRIK